MRLRASLPVIQCRKAAVVVVVADIVVIVADVVSVILLHRTCESSNHNNDK